LDEPSALSSELATVALRAERDELVVDIEPERPAAVATIIEDAALGASERWARPAHVAEQILNRRRPMERAWFLESVQDLVDAIVEVRHHALGSIAAAVVLSMSSSSC
jgi:hypothetical protein